MRNLATIWILSSKVRSARRGKEVAMAWERIDKQDGATDGITDAQARRAAEGSYHDVDMALATGEFQTPFAIYREVNESEGEASPSGL